LVKENLLPVVTAIVNRIISLRYKRRESARHEVDYTTSEVCYYNRYSFTATNLNTFGPMCISFIMVTLFHPNIYILGIAGMSMQCHCVSPHNKIATIVIV